MVIKYSHRSEKFSAATRAYSPNHSGDWSDTHPPRSWRLWGYSQWNNVINGSIPFSFIK